MPSGNSVEDVAPNICELSKDSIQFSNAYSQGIWTYPSAATIFTGTYPQVHNSHQHDIPLDSKLPHITDGTSDITTACFSTTLGVSPERNFEQNFDEFYHIAKNGEPLQPNIMGILNDNLLDWIEKNKDEEFLLVVWAMGTHHPYKTPSEFDNPSRQLNNTDEGSAAWMMDQPISNSSKIKDLYLNTVQHTDDKFGEMIHKLKNIGIYDETNIIATSDHGEIFDEHARMEHASKFIKGAIPKLIGEKRCQRNLLFEPTSFLGHQAVYPYKELTHVPLFYKISSNNTSPVDKYDGIVELVDIVETIRSIFGIDGMNTQGNNLLSYIRTESTKELSYSSSQFFNGNLVFQSVHDGEYQYMTRDLVTEKVRDRKKAVQSLLSYIFGDNKTIVEFDSGKRVNNNEMTKIMSIDLTNKIDECKVYKRELGVNNSDGISVSQETADHLEDLGYK